MSKIQLGVVADKTSKVTRDAVHVCVCTCLAHEEINPGEQVRFYAMAGETPLVRPFKKSPKYKVEIFGVADPFYPKEITRGTLFYVLMWPGSTANLRHEWDHPQLKPAVNPVVKDIARSIDTTCQGCFDDEPEEYDECQGCNG